MNFHDSYEPIPESGCWIWMRGRGTNGYGYLWESGKMVSAHRVSWRLHRGEIPQGMHVLHRCDVRCCVNPAHLFLGSNADNVHDMDAKGRRVNAQLAGEKHNCAKLTESEVIAIRSDPRGGHRLGPVYGVSKTTIDRIKNRRIWRHV